MGAWQIHHVPESSILPKFYDANLLHDGEELVSNDMETVYDAGKQKAHSSNLGKRLCNRSIYDDAQKDSVSTTDVIPSQMTPITVPSTTTPSPACDDDPPPLPASPSNPRCRSRTAPNIRIPFRNTFNLSLIDYQTKEEIFVPGLTAQSKVWEIREAAQRTWGNRVMEQVLWHNGVVMVDRASLRDYGIWTGDGAYVGLLAADESSQESNGEHYESDGQYRHSERNSGIRNVPPFKRPRQKFRSYQTDLRAALSNTPYHTPRPTLNLTVCQPMKRGGQGNLWIQNVAADTTVRKIKELIYKAWGQPPHMQILIYQKQRWTDESSLKSIGITKDARVWIVLKNTAIGGTR